MECRKPLVRRRQPPPLGDVLNVLRLTAEQQVTLIALSFRMEGFDVHWNGHHTVRCTGGKGLCLAHSKQLPLRWVGYIHCYISGEGTECALEVTPEAGTKIFGWEEQGNSLRGQLLFVHRARKHKRSPLVVHLKGTVDNVELLPPAKSIEPTFLRLYKVES